MTGTASGAGGAGGSSCAGSARGAGSTFGDGDTETALGVTACGVAALGVGALEGTLDGARDASFGVIAAGVGAFELRLTTSGIGNEAIFGDGTGDKALEAAVGASPAEGGLGVAAPDGDALGVATGEGAFDTALGVATGVGTFDAALDVATALPFTVTSRDRNHDQPPSSHVAGRCPLRLQAMNGLTDVALEL